MNFSAHQRARARRYAMQALYQWLLSGGELGDVMQQFLETEDFSRADANYFGKILNEISEHIESIDKYISESIDRPLGQLDPVEHSILRLAVCELRYHIDIPYRVSINEAVQLAKKFGAEQGHSFVNAVLDKLAHQLRPDECKRANGRAAGR